MSGVAALRKRRYLAVSAIDHSLPHICLQGMRYMQKASLRAGRIAAALAKVGQMMFVVMIRAMEEVVSLLAAIPRIT